MENLNTIHTLSASDNKIDSGAELFDVNVSEKYVEIREVNSPKFASVSSEFTTIQLAKLLLMVRRMRARHLSEVEFGEPSWDILLDLYVARMEERRVSASSLCIAAAVPATTALRWISVMVKSQQLRRRPDPSDGRRVYIELTEQTAASMQIYLEHTALMFFKMIGRR